MTGASWMTELTRLKESLMDENLPPRERCVLQQRVVEILEAQVVKERHAWEGNPFEVSMPPLPAPAEWMKVERFGDALICTIPRLLPRKHSQHAKIRSFYHAMYEASFAKILEAETFPSRQVVIWYVHCYRKFSSHTILDHDNIETKVMTDLLVKYLHTDDSPVFCETHVSSVPCGRDMTKILLLPADCFSKWYERKEELMRIWNEDQSSTGREVLPDEL